MQTWSSCYRKVYKETLMMPKR